MARRSKIEVLIQAKTHLEDAGDWLDAAKETQQEAFLIDMELTLEYRRQWRDDLTIEGLKRHRDALLMQADECRTNAKRDMRKNNNLLRLARFMRG